MRSRLFLLVLALGAAVCTGGRVDAATRGDTASIATRRTEAPAVERIDVAAPTSVAATRWTIAGPSTFALGAWTLAGLGFLRWKRRRYLAEHAAI